jgi:hypothetical protein
MVVNSQNSASGGTSNLRGKRVALTSAERHNRPRPLPAIAGHLRPRAPAHTRRQTLTTVGISLCRGGDSRRSLKLHCTAKIAKQSLNSVQRSTLSASTLQAVAACAAMSEIVASREHVLMRGARFLPAPSGGLRALAMQTAQIIDTRQKRAVVAASTITTPPTRRSATAFDRADGDWWGPRPPASFRRLRQRQE